MTQDPRLTARTAREGLAQGLQLLQTPGLPEGFIHCAEPIARAMGSLMTAERGDGAVHNVKPHAEVALVALRDALSRLQAINTTHPAAEQAMAAVASSLGSVHALSKLEAAPSPNLGNLAFQETMQPQPSPMPQFQPAPNFQPPPAAPQYQPPPAAPQFQPPPQQAAPQYQAPPFQPPVQPPAPNIAYQGSVRSPSNAPPGGPDSLPLAAGMVEAELGAHSMSNFYKTLSGNDIVEHGGLFVATYNVPKMNQRVQLRVHLPGGYQFDCAGLVRWTREGRDNPDAPPGFGAQLQNVTAEQRQLIMRYVRNREPLFYDDL